MSEALKIKNYDHIRRNSYKFTDDFGFTNPSGSVTVYFFGAVERTIHKIKPIRIIHKKKSR